MAISDPMLGRLDFGKNMEFITDIASQMISLDKGYSGEAKLNNQEPVSSLQLTLASNMGFRIRDDQLDTKDLNKIDV